MMLPLRFGCYIADVNGSKRSCEAMNCKTNGSRTNALRGCQRDGAGSGGAIGRRGTESGVNASSRMSTRRTGHRGRDESSAQRSRLECSVADVNEPGPWQRWRDRPPRQRGQRGCCIADVNALAAGSGEAMSPRGNGAGSNALSQISTSRNRGSDGAIGRRRNDPGANAISQMSTRRERATVRR